VPSRLATNPKQKPSQADRAEHEKHDAILVRVLGNDLPPRHKCGQTLANLEFILQHERNWPELAKHWVVNRIWDRRIENEILRVLDSLGQSYLHIPFDLRKYAQEPFDYRALPCASSTEFRRMSRPQRLRADLHARRNRSNYAINNNGARRAALDYGRDKAKWVLPWDGNSFLTENAWQEIKQAIWDNDNLPYLVVPMARVADNRQLLDDTFHPKATEEPQIIFRCDALETFDPGRPYGRRPKVELLWRLGVPGPWDQFEDDPWDLSRPPLSREAGKFASAGWVARLESGHRHLEKPTRWSGWRRGQVRTTSIIAALDKLDAEVASSSLPPGPLLLDETRLAAAAQAWNKKSGPFYGPASALLTAATPMLENQATFSFRSIIIRTLAWRISGDKAHARAAATSLHSKRSFFCFRPTLLGRKTSPQAAEELGFFLDAVRLLQMSSFVREEEVARLKKTLTRALDRWTRGWWGFRFSRQANANSLPHAVRDAVISAFLQRHARLASILRREHARFACESHPTENKSLRLRVLLSLVAERAGLEIPRDKLGNEKLSLLAPLDRTRTDSNPRQIEDLPLEMLFAAQPSRSSAEALPTEGANPHDWLEAVWLLTSLPSRK
jgi:hypothetical protein